MFIRSLTLALCLLTTACANGPGIEQPLQQWSPEYDASAISQIEGNRSSELAVLLAFSGGGTRASALSYGVLQELGKISVPSEHGERTLLQEVDVISSVSGGSFTAAYYGLYGDRLFVDFDEKFLRKNVEGELVLQTFNPVNWFRLLGGHYGRSDLAAEYYDRTIFDGATFADMQRKDGPLVILNATDLASGMRFPFFEGSFGPLCIDLGSYPVSRAVAASSAVPVVFTPVALRNHAGECGYQLSSWTQESLAEAEPSARKSQARVMAEYFDRERRPWLHLVDGGISDNLGLRSYYNTLDVLNDPRGLVSRLLGEKVRNILIVVVNAEVSPHPHLALKRAAPSTSEVVSSVVIEQMSRYSRDTIHLVSDKYRNLAADLSTPSRDVNFHLVEVSFDGIRDREQRDYFNGVPTNFDLSDEEVDAIITAAGQLLRDSADFQAFLSSISASQSD